MDAPGTGTMGHQQTTGEVVTVAHTECLVCEAVTVDVWLCAVHRHDLLVMLNRVPGLARDLETTAAKQDHIGGTVGSPGQGGPAPAIVNFDAADVLARLRYLLHIWTHRAYKLHRKHHPESFSIPHMAGFLLGQLPEMVATQPVGALFTELEAIVREAVKAVDLPQNRQGMKYAGACGATFDNGTCPNQLWAMTGENVITCKRCGTVWDADDRRDSALDAAENLSAPATVISRALTTQGYPVTAEMIYLWKLRGRISPTGTNKASQHVYRVGDVMDLLMKAPNVKGARS